MTKHLDIGCGEKPRNPFNCNELYGIDIIDFHSADFHYTKSNVVLEKIPFPDNTFDSISAYDFLEHIPRVYIHNHKSTFPFVEFMNEMYRVLKPEGIFYAITPCYPRAEIFVDPTHVNFISKDTYKYFTLPKLKAKMYGFNGVFEKVRIKRIKLSQETKKHSLIAKFLKNIYYTVHYTKKSHILWEFKAVKQKN